MGRGWEGMNELRYDVLRGEWVMVAPERQERPMLPSAKCPFCPGSPGVPKDYEVLLYPNDFPSLSTSVKGVEKSQNPFFLSRPSYGYCDVVLYTPQHDLTFSRLSLEQIGKVIRVWQERSAQLQKDAKIRFILIFENKGATIGVTLHHPHGQIYAFPYIPPVIQKEIQQGRRYFKKRSRCLFCDVREAEIKEGKRVIEKTSDFVAFIPYSAHWPYEVHIHPCRHFSSVVEMGKREGEELSLLLKTLTLKYDHLFGFSFPYMMVLHQAPVNGRVSNLSDFYHFHIEFYPPYRGRDKLKFRASVETGAGSFINDTIPEEKAKELRCASPTLKEVQREGFPFSPGSPPAGYTP